MADFRGIRLPFHPCDHVLGHRRDKRRRQRDRHQGHCPITAHHPLGDFGDRRGTEHPNDLAWAFRRSRTVCDSDSAYWRSAVGQSTGSIQDRDGHRLISLIGPRLLDQLRRTPTLRVGRRASWPALPPPASSSRETGSRQRSPPPARSPRSRPACDSRTFVWLPSNISLMLLKHAPLEPPARARWRHQNPSESMDERLFSLLVRPVPGRSDQHGKSKRGQFLPKLPDVGTKRKDSSWSRKARKARQPKPPDFTCISIGNRAPGSRTICGAGSVHL